MDTSSIVEPSGRRTHRRHSADFKARVVAACRQPGVSIASVALAKAANSAVPAAFVSVQLPPAQAVPTDIRIELRRGPIAISVSWPCTAASQCAAWMRELQIGRASCRERVSPYV